MFFLRENSSNFFILRICFLKISNRAQYQSSEALTSPSFKLQKQIFKIFLKLRKRQTDFRLKFNPQTKFSGESYGLAKNVHIKFKKIANQHIYHFQKIQVLSKKNP